MPLGQLTVLMDENEKFYDFMLYFGALHNAFSHQGDWSDGKADGRFKNYTKMGSEYNSSLSKYIPGPTNSTDG